MSSSWGPWTDAELTHHLGQAEQRRHRRHHTEELLARAEATLAGALRGADPTLLSRTMALMVAEATSAAEIAQVARMWESPKLGVGEAWFPVVLGDKGYVYTLRVGRRDEDVVRPECDADFNAAVEHARRWASAALNIDDTSELNWTVYPELRTHKGAPTRFTGGSVFSAAIVAWYGYLSRRRPREHAVWTGCPAQGIGELLVRPVEASTLPLKVKAAANLGAGTLYVPEGQDNQPWPLRALQVVRRPADIVARAFGVEAVRARRATTATSGLEVARLTASSLRVVYVLEAARDALTDEELTAAVYHPAWPEPLGSEAGVLDVALAPLGAHVTREGSRFLLARDDVAEVGADPRFRRVAHVALAEARADDEARSLHRCIADGSASVLAAALEQPARARNLLARLEDAEGSTRVSERLAQVPYDGPGGCARLAWEAGALSAPCNLVAGCIFRSETDVDMLLSVQALAEALLHVLAAAAVALRTTRLEAELAQRPNIGDLATAGRSLLAEGPPHVHPVHAALRVALAPIAEDLRTCAQVFNDALHGRGAFLQRHARGADKHLGAAVALTGRLVRALRPILLPGAFGPSGAGKSWTLRVNGSELQLRDQVRTGDDDGPVFRRGNLDGKERYWAFHGAQDAWPHGRPYDLAPAPHQQPHGSELPTPLARLVTALRRGPHAPLAVLALADLVLAVTLRLAWFRFLAADPARSAEARRILVGEADEPQTIARKNHRNVWEVVKGSGEVAAARSSYLYLIDRIERLAHAPGPVAAHADAIEALRPHLVALCDRAHWTERALFGFDGTRWWRLAGTTPQSAEAPVGCERAVAGATVLVHEGSTFELSPFIVFRDREAFLYQEGIGKRATHASLVAGATRSELPQINFRSATELCVRDWVPTAHARST